MNKYLICKDQNFRNFEILHLETLQKSCDSKDSQLFYFMASKSLGYNSRNKNAKFIYD